MSTTSDTPTFNLKVVLQETGIKPDTIRAWERRYGLPKPRRTEGGHRLYSQHDIEMIKWLMARQEEGLSISRAVDLWRSLEDEGQNPLDLREATAAPSQAAASSAMNLALGAALEEIRKAWVDTCLAFDEPRADNVLTQAFALYPAETVCLEVLQKGIAQIGLGWYRGQASVQQEHFSTALALRKLNTLIAACPSPHHSQKLIIACPPAEDHTFSALFLTYALRLRGWPIIYLGPNVPLEELEETIAGLRPSLLVMPAQQLHTAATLAHVAWQLRHKVNIAFGGMIFNLLPEIRQRIPGYFIGEELQDSAPTIEQIIQQPPPIPDASPPSVEYQAALTHFQEQKAALESHIWQRIRGNGIQRQHLVEANKYLSQDIEAALALGDIEYLGNEITWIKELLENHGTPTAGLQHFLYAYRQAAHEILDERGLPILQWLNQQLPVGEDA